MWALIFLCLFGANSYRLTLNQVEAAPEIDGRIESLWSSGDSVSKFVQIQPNEGELATEKTTVYVLGTDRAIYFAFRCEAKKIKAFLSTWDEGKGDGVQVYLDTFEDKRTGYFFEVNARGVQKDGVISDDGRTNDVTWDGVWFASARIYKWGYVVEIKIPYRTLRYKGGLTTWGVDFSRYISEKFEVDYWAPMKRNEGLRVSRFGSLLGVNPKVEARHIELYPVSFIRHNEYEGESPKNTPHLGADIAWSPTSHSDISITVNPDFGEVEADPFKVNLSKYTLYYPEKRPFFVKGTEMFNIIPKTDSDFAPPMRLFYSRQIGKKLPNGEEVPILFGAKIIEKRRLWESGILVSRTDPRDGEPSAFFAALRSKRQFLGNSTVGLYLGDKEENFTGDFERVLSLDTELRGREREFNTQFAFLSENDIKDRFIRTQLFHMGTHLFFNFGYVDIGDSFALSGIGFVPYKGYKQWDLSLGPTFYPKKVFRYLYFGLSAGQIRELNEPKRSWYMDLSGYFDFRNNYGFLGAWGIGREYESSHYFGDHKGQFSFWTDWTKKIYLDFSGGYDYGYCDYSVSPCVFRLAYQGWGTLDITLRPSPSLSFIASGERYYQFKENKGIREVTSILRPQLQWSLSKSLSLFLYAEGVRSKNLGKFFQWRLGGTLSLMVAPKSWFYLAFNDLKERDNNTRFRVKERIGVVKLRYLFYF